MSQRNLNELVASIINHSDIALICHVSPDGDTLGSALALMHALDKMGKCSTVYCQDEVPHMFAFLPGADRVIKYSQDQFGNRIRQEMLAIFIDTADDKRAGNCIAIREYADETFALDHHVTHVNFTDVDIVEPEAAATAIIVMKLIEQISEIDEVIASCLYTAISTDTGNFNFSNTDSEALLAAAKCIDSGANVEELSLRLFRLKSMSRVCLMQLALNHLCFLFDGKVSLVTLSKQDYESCGAGDGDGEGIVSYIMEVEGVLAAIFARELTGQIKFSLRSSKALDISKVAHRFGGGGHKQAAGVTMDRDMESCVKLITKAVEDEMRDVNLWTDM